MKNSYWKPVQSPEFKELVKESIALKNEDRELFKTAGAGREILAIPEIVKSCLFYSLGKYHKAQGDYFTATSDFFYSMFHSSVAIYKVHFKNKIDPKIEFDPTAITVKRKEITKFVDELRKSGLLSNDFRRTYESLQKRRDHISYQPRIIMSGNKKETITFFSCQYGNLVNDIDSAEGSLPKFILESAEMVSNILRFYHSKSYFKDITAILYFKNWAKTCLMVYGHWGSAVESELEGDRFSWDSGFKYTVSDKTKKAIIPSVVLNEAELLVNSILEHMKSTFTEP